MGEPCNNLYFCYHSTPSIPFLTYKAGISKIISANLCSVFLFLNSFVIGTQLKTFFEGGLDAILKFFN